MRPETIISIRAQKLHYYSKKEMLPVMVKGKLEIYQHT